jgi:hypothetical protein
VFSGLDACWRGLGRQGLRCKLPPCLGAADPPPEVQGLPGGLGIARPPTPAICQQTGLPPPGVLRLAVRAPRGYTPRPRLWTGR